MTSVKTFEHRFGSELQYGDVIVLTAVAGEKPFSIELISEHKSLDAPLLIRLLNETVDVQEAGDDCIPLVELEPLRILIEPTGHWDVNANGPNLGICANGTNARRFGYSVGSRFECKIGITPEFFQIYMNRGFMTNSDHIVPVGTIVGIQLGGDYQLDSIFYGNPSAVEEFSSRQLPSDNPFAVECRLTTSDQQLSAKLYKPRQAKPTNNDQKISDSDQPIIQLESPIELFAPDLNFNDADDDEDNHRELVDLDLKGVRRSTSYQLVFDTETDVSQLTNGVDHTDEHTPRQETQQQAIGRTNSRPPRLITDKIPTQTNSMRNLVSPRDDYEEFHNEQCTELLSDVGGVKHGSMFNIIPSINCTPTDSPSDLTYRDKTSTIEDWSFETDEFDSHEFSASLPRPRILRSYKTPNNIGNDNHAGARLIPITKKNAFPPSNLRNSKSPTVTISPNQSINSNIPDRNLPSQRRPVLRSHIHNGTPNRHSTNGFVGSQNDKNCDSQSTDSTEPQILQHDTGSIPTDNGSSPTNQIEEHLPTNTIPTSDDCKDGQRENGSVHKQAGEKPIHQSDRPIDGNWNEIRKDDEYCLNKAIGNGESCDQHSNKKLERINSIDQSKVKVKGDCDTGKRTNLQKLVEKPKRWISRKLATVKK